MFTEIRDITDSNKQEILGLHIADEQEGFIETVLQCLNEANEDPRFIPVGLYKENVPIGFAMYGPFQYPDGMRVWLDRFFIDEHYQGKGYGRYYFKLLILFLADKYSCERIYLSVYENNLVAIKMYEKFGFKFNGELDVQGEKVMVLNLKNMQW